MAARICVRAGRLAWLMVLLLPACTSVGPFDIVRVGVVAPLTGERAAVGRDVVDAVQLAVDEWNSSGGVNGVHLEIVRSDENVDAPVRPLLADPRVVITVGVTDPAVAARLHTAFGDPSAPAAVLLANPGPDGRPQGVVELAPTVQQVQEVAAAAVAFNFGPVPVTVVASGTAEDIAAARAFMQAAPARGLQVRSSLTLANVETSYAQAALLVRNAAAPFVYVAGRGVDAGALWAELRPRDTRVRLVLGPGALDEGFFRTAGGFLEGIHAVDLTVRAAETPTGTAFSEAFTARFGRPPSAMAARAYDAAGLARQSIRAAIERGDRSRGAVRGALSSWLDYRGVLRTYTLQDGAPTGWKLAVYRLDRDGTRVLMGEREIK